MSAPTLHTLAGAPVPLLTTREAAAYCRVTPQALVCLVCRERRRPGSTFPVRKFGGQLRFMQAELDAWMLAQATTARRSATRRRRVRRVEPPSSTAPTSCDP